MRKRIIAILTVIAFGLAIGGAFWVKYQDTRLEAEAYKYCLDNQYTATKSLEVTDIIKVNDNEYDIYYTYIDNDGKNHRATKNAVTL